VKVICPWRVSFNQRRTWINYETDDSLWNKCWSGRLTGVTSFRSDELHVSNVQGLNKNNLDVTSKTTESATLDRRTLNAVAELWTTSDKLTHARDTSSRPLAVSITINHLITFSFTVDELLIENRRHWRYRVARWYITSWHYFIDHYSISVLLILLLLNDLLLNTISYATWSARLRN